MRTGLSNKRPSLRGGAIVALLMGMLALAANADETISNTATLDFEVGPEPMTQASNTTTLLTVPPATPAAVRFWQYSPNRASDSTPFGGGQYDPGDGNFIPLANPETLGGTPINLNEAVPVRETGLYHSGEPVFITLEDANRNLEAAVIDTITLTLSNPLTGDVEVLELRETGPDTGVFSAVIPSVGPNQAGPNDGRISVGINHQLQVHYQDPFYPADAVDDFALVDPYGFVFDSQTGVPISGVTVTVIDVSTGLPAAVFGDDGFSTYPATVVTGGTVTDSSGQVYNPPPGQFRFPYMYPGDYRFVVTPSPDYTMPSTRTPVELGADPDTTAYTIVTGSYGDAFELVDTILHIDIPIDPPADPNQTLSLRKTVSRTEASAGDFLLYTLTVTNLDPANAATNIILVDTLPAGMRYQEGSLTVAGATVSDPGIGNDGRTLAIPVGDLPAGGNTTVSYVTEVVTRRAQREAINRAQAQADGGVISNEALAAVRIREPLMDGAFTIVGEVSCGKPAPMAPACAPVAPPEPGMPSNTFTVQANFDSGRATLKPAGKLDLDDLAAKLAGRDIVRLELIGHTDSQRVGNPRTLRLFGNNHGLSRARAQAVGEYLAGKLGLGPDQISAVGRGPDEPVASNATPAGMAQNRRTEVRVFERTASGITGLQSCEMPAPESGATAGHRGIPNVRILLDDGTYTTTDVDGRYHFEGVRPGTHVVQVDLESLPLGHKVLPGIQNTRYAGRAYSKFVDVRGGGLWRADFQACPDASEAGMAGSPAKAAGKPKIRDVIEDSVTAAGGGIDWLERAKGPGVAWLYPVTGQPPRHSATRVVIQHGPRQSVQLKLNGEPVNPLNFDGMKSDPARGIAVSTWRGVDLRDGENRFEAQVLDVVGGQVVQTLDQVVHFGGAAVRAELVPEQSVLVADGIQRPVLAVRLVDRDGNPARNGMSGTFSLSPPYQPWETLEQQQRRALAGTDRVQPTWYVEGEKGIAYIELMPTTDSGTAVVRFNFEEVNGNFRTDARRGRQQELRAWLESPPRDWVLVGFVDGTVGYNTLKDNVAALPAGTEDELYTDGQASFYGKGRVLGKWLLTIAYDSDKPDELERRRSLLSTIDPNEYYTLYGDGSGQRYDAASQDKLYLKLERGQFYALFGDYNTGLTVTQLSRYSRTLNGVKSEYGAGPVVFNAFAAETAQNSARDEIRGDGTSGLYRLSHTPIVLNSEKIRLETRDRTRSQLVVRSRALTRHIDYDIDYSAATLWFKTPVPSRDTDFNPIFIVADYETFGAGEPEVNAGGRVGVQLFGNRLQAGVSGISERQADAESELAGADIRLRVGQLSELRLEAARSDTRQVAADLEGTAWLAEYEHRGDVVSGLLYKRRQEPGFGLNQQNLSESGTEKTGLDGQLHLTQSFSLLGQAYRQETLASEATRDVASAGVQYMTDVTRLRAGYQSAEDTAATGETFTSEQVTVGAGRRFGRLDLQANADVGLSDQNANADFPSRYQAGASFALTPEARVILVQEYTDGDAFDTSMTRFGVELTPWAGARLNSTVSQQAISEYGPRTFGQFGLTQALLIGERWGADLSLDSSRTFNESGAVPFIVNPNQPSVVAGASLTEDYVAISGGLTYRAELWSWNSRAESRKGSTSDRYGLTTNLLRQATAGIAFSANLQGFRQSNVTGSEGFFGTAGLAWAFRPLESRWSILDRLEFKFDRLQQGTGQADASGGALFGNTSLTVVGNATSRRLVNNLAINRVSGEWTEEDRRGNLFKLSQRNQWSLYYGAKYTMDTYNGVDYSGYTDLLGLEWRYDLTRHWDIGLQASSLNSWKNRTHDYSAGPSVGWSPMVNGWLSLGYNLIGFYDRDFEAARYTAQGPYLKLRFKFDQNTRLMQDRSDPRATDWAGLEESP